MKVYFLGTGTSQGIPVIGSNHPVCKSTDFKDKRLRVSVWVSWENYSFVIDCGPDFRQQMLSSNCQKVEGILFTHEHSDHTAGIDDIRPFNFKQGKIPIYAHQRVIDNIKRRFEYVFETVNKYPGAPSVETIEVINNQPFPLGNKMVIPIDVMHGNLQVFGYRIDDFAYLTDVKTIEKSEIEKLKNLKVLVINALREEPHDMHFNLKEALDFITLVQPKTTYLTHISHIMGFHEEVQKRLPENVFLAYDNLEITI
ncbi:MAG TPA: MBL fold metallo-hydrolase [Flavobacterium sp.]|uniref:MBL fold metallo-hydrolase n=1 Tax=Flavobacterium sp. TaxID=239 RepID=UPI001B494602|nr:MBL fold metallo-hydrolase [Flavobacterium sp.]MBP6146408.1 MBL fold metallo-hydrolase [Flavobacterium sp.]MBP7182781.1 MBL fold metallo-hydrolase [Flavobacterium sp.]MBP7317876.1 MBL fold metallo-hydrolase [Flavobacterium sp.]MBP8886461.1 MBL fold metallo-hydrolase [Flavobacterium sp.]HRL70306.1 MBL fold metallo-hydrolase [Flavobacterium sp.]